MEGDGRGRVWECVREKEGHVKGVCVRVCEGERGGCGSVRGREEGVGLKEG